MRKWAASFCVFDFDRDLVSIKKKKNPYVQLSVKSFQKIFFFSFFNFKSLNVIEIKHILPYFSLPRGPEFEPQWILWAFHGSLLGKGTLDLQTSTAETQERHE